MSSGSSDSQSISEFKFETTSESDKGSIRGCYNNEPEYSQEEIRSSLIYNTSTRNERHEWHECNTSATLGTRVQHEQHKCNTSATRVRHECYTNNKSVTRVKNFDFDNGTSKNIFSHPYIYYVASERL